MQNRDSFINKLIVSVFALFVCVSGNLEAQIQFDFNSEYKYLKGSEAAGIAANWMTEDFDASGWEPASAPFRYGDGTGGTLLTDMQNNYSSLYLRSTFNAFSIDRIKEIKLSVNYDDGFVVWINGVQALSRNAPAALTSTSLAPVNSESGTVVSFSLDSADVQLVEGENLLCVQGLNNTLGSSDFYFDMSISASLSLPEVADSLKVLFDHEAGFYDTAFNLALRTDKPGYNIIYTLDGSNPQTSTSGYQGGTSVSILVDPGSPAGRAKTPVFVVRASLAKDGLTPSKPVTKSFIFLDKVMTQAYPGGSWPTSSVNGQLIDLAMDPDVVNDPRYNSQMKESLLEIPSISLVTGNANMFNPSTGIYVNATLHGEQWERECSVELINPDKSQGFQVNAGVRIRGGDSRNDSNPKHAFRLFFRKEYGAGKLVFPLFGDEGASEFDKVDLRTEQNYSWNKEGGAHNTFLRDIFSRDLQREMGQPYARGRYYHLYLNGMYWGLYQTEERPEANYAETYLGGEKEDYDVIKVSTETWPYYNEATDGTMASWQYLYNKCATGFKTNANYFALEGKDQYGNPVKNARVYVDIDNLIDYMLVIFYTGNVDAPVSAWFSNMMPNNYYAVISRENKGKGFVFICHDSEHSMFIDPINVNDGINENRVTIDDPAMTVSGISNFQPQWLHKKLTENPEYCLRFADRAYRQFSPGGVFTYDRCIKRFRERKNQINMAIIAESARWGDAKSSTPKNKIDDWLPELSDIENNYFPYRSEIVISQLKAAGLYGSLEPPVIRESGIVLTENTTFSSPLTLLFENPNSKGTIYYTTDGCDPRVIGGTVSSSAKVAGDNSSVVVSATTIIKSRIVDGQTWSPLKEISFTDNNEDYSNLKVTEVHYHPADYIFGTDTTDGKDLEFIELKNTGSSSINISGVTIDTAVYYAVPAGAILPPKGFYVVASDPGSFYNYYGMNASGNFKGNLSNSGEYILINDQSRRKILSVLYSDDYPWPLSADGDGYSLVAKTSIPTSDPNVYSYWKSSIRIGGSPFADDDAPTAIGTVKDNQDKGKLKIYPNPASDLLNISIDDQISGVISLKLTDINGSTVLIKEVENNSGMDLTETGLAAGVYIVTVEYSGACLHSILIYKPKK